MFYIIKNSLKYWTLLYSNITETHIIVLVHYTLGLYNVIRIPTGNIAVQTFNQFVNKAITQFLD